MKKANTKTKVKETERGAAGMLIELQDGNITVYHCEGHVKLAELKNAPLGTWKVLWASMESLGINRVVGER